MASGMDAIVANVGRMTMASEKKFYNVQSAAAFIGLSSCRHMNVISEKAGVVPHNFGGPGVRRRFMWTHDQMLQIQRSREQDQKEKENEREYRRQNPKHHRGASVRQAGRSSADVDTGEP